MNGRAFASIFVLLLTGSAAYADKKPQVSGSALIDDLRACRKLTDINERLTCFDRATASIDEAIERKDIVVVDRETVRQTRRSLFGFELPKINLFGGGDKGGEEPDQKEINAKIASAQPIGSGRWQLTLDDGAIWQTTESSSTLEPRSGDSVRISRAALGSYFLNVPGSRGVKARRVG